MSKSKQEAPVKAPTLQALFAQWVDPAKVYIRPVKYISVGTISFAHLKT